MSDGVVSSPVFILQTWYVPHSHPVYVYRIECGRQQQVPILLDRVVYHTADADVFADALDCERFPVRVTVTWHWDGNIKVADRLTLAGWVAERQTDEAPH